MFYLLINAVLSINLNVTTPTSIYDVASRYSSYPSTIVGISYVETRYGLDKGHHLAKGVMQLQPPTVRYLATKYPQLRWVSHTTDAQLAYILQHNDHINIMIGSYLFEYNLARYDYKQAVMAYNRRGNYIYYTKVLKAIQ